MNELLLTTSLTQPLLVPRIIFSLDYRKQNHEDHVHDVRWFKNDTISKISENINTDKKKITFSKFLHDLIFLICWQNVFLKIRH